MLLESVVNGFPEAAEAEYSSISFDYGGHAHKFTQQDINRMYSLADLAAPLIDYAERLTVGK